jgi:hypothetical protein
MYVPETPKAEKIQCEKQCSGGPLPAAWPQTYMTFRCLLLIELESY